MVASLLRILKTLGIGMLLSLLPLALAANLVNYYWLDSVFAVFIVMGLVWWGLSKHVSLQDYFSFKKTPANIFFVLFIVSGILGYLMYSPMLAKQWEEISSLRWIFGFYGACFIGHFYFYNKGRLGFLPLPVLFVLGWLIRRHYVQTEGRFFNIEMRFTGFYENTNHFALALALLWAYFLGLAFLENKKRLALSVNILTLLVAFVTILATYSRSSWLALIGVFAVALWYVRQKRLIYVACALAVTLAVGISLNLFGLKERLIYSLDTSSLNSQVSRMTVWKVAGQIFLDHPLFGVGFEENARKFPEYYNKMGFGTDFIVGHAHNQYLEVLSGAGLFGFIGYMGAFIVGLIYFHRRFKNAASQEEKQVALAAILLIVALTISSFTDAPFRLHEARNYVLLLLGFSYGYLKASDRSERVS